MTDVFRVAVDLLGGSSREDLDATLGRADRQVDLFDDAAGFCEQSLPENSVYRLLARERDRLFPDELFADLFTDRGRRSVPPSVVARCWCCSGWRGCRIGRRSIGTPSTCPGVTRPGSAVTALEGGRGSRTRCW